MNMKVEIKQAIASTAKKSTETDSIAAQQYAQATLNLANALATIEEIERREESVKDDS